MLQLFLNDVLGGLHYFNFFSLIVNNYIPELFSIRLPV